MATKLCCCIPFPWSSSSDDEDGRDPASAESVSFSQTVPGATRCEGAPFSGSSNVPLKSEGEDVDANLNVSGGPRDEAPVSGSSNVPLEGQNVRVNFNVSGASKCDEVPSSSPIVSTNSVIKSILHEDIVAVEGENVNVNLDDLMEHISELLKRRKEKKRLPLETSTSRKWTFPGGSDLKNLKEIMSSGIEFLSDWKSYISGPVKAILKGIGKASVATAGLLVVAYTLERFDDLSTNKEESLDLLKEIVYVANLVKIFKQSPKGSHGVIEDAKELIVEGAVMCCVQMDTSHWKSFLLTSKNKDELSDIREKLNLIYKKINIEIGLRVSSDIERVLTAIEPKRNSPLSKEYPEHAVGIEKSIKDVMKLLECESEQNVVTVILHGFGGMGKTTLADAVFSQVKGGKCSEVKLFNAIGSKPDIIQLQKKMLEHLMEPGELIPDIPKPEDGQRALGKRLKEVEAFIYIDNVLDRVELKSLLPQDLDKAKKVRLLLTARDKNVKYAMPGSTPTKIYPMEGIKNPKAALSILRKDILEGIDSSQFDEIIKTCHGIPLMLKLVALFIAHAADKGAAYSELMQAEEKWNNEGFNEMHYAFAYDALPEKCKDPFLDICSYFKRWDWDTVGKIVGKNELEMLESRALVTKDI